MKTRFFAVQKNINSHCGEVVNDVLGKKTIMRAMRDVGISEILFI